MVNSHLCILPFRDRIGLVMTKAPRETTSTMTRTSIRAPALAVSALRSERTRLRTHTLILLNATAAGFQSLDPPQDPPATSSSCPRAPHSPRRPRRRCPSTQTHTLVPRTALSPKDLFYKTCLTHARHHTSCKQGSIPADLICSNQITARAD